MPEVSTITALQNTVLKKNWQAQAVDLPADQKHNVKVGKAYKVSHCEERAADGPMCGHLQVEIKHGGGTWYIFGEHWELPWQKGPEPRGSLPEWQEVDWADWRSPVSKYFSVGEVTLRSHERIPTEKTVKQNIIRVARQMDDIRDWWGGPIGVTSWYRPWKVNRRIGSRAPNHPSGSGVDFRPINGRTREMENRFKAEWYDAGRWSGGFGKGSRRGFIHIDMRHKRTWDY